MATCGGGRVQKRKRSVKKIKTPPLSIWSEYWDLQAIARLLGLRRQVPKIADGLKCTSYIAASLYLRIPAASQRVSLSMMTKDNCFEVAVEH